MEKIRLPRDKLLENMLKDLMMKALLATEDCLSDYRVTYSHSHSLVE